MSESARILLWDIETTNLNADFGYLLAIGYKWLGEKATHVLAINRGKNARKFQFEERELIKKFVPIFNSADVIVGHYSKGFDLPYMKAKMLEHHLGILAPPAHVDTYFVARSNLKISRKSLQNLAYYLGVGVEKTPVEGRIWVEAMMGSRSALQYIVEHCRKDVLVLEAVYKVLRPYVRQHPRVSGYGPCRVCGSIRLQSRGRAITIYKNPQRRVCCQDCGTWEVRPL